MTHVQITIEVDDEYADDQHETGLSEEGNDALMEAVNSVGTLVDGPSLVAR